MSAIEATPPAGFAWGPIREGTAVAKPTTVDLDGHTATVTPLWSDDEGVTFDVALPDLPLTRNALGKVIDTLNRISMMSPFY